MAAAASVCADPQLVSLRRLLQSIGRVQYAEFGARLGPYCLQPVDNLGKDGSNGLQISCLGPYINSISYVNNGILAANMLNGTLPAAVQLPGLNHLQRFTCAGCQLVGTFPPDWGTSNNLLALQHLDLGTNLLSGTLPPSWGGLVNLVNMTLSSGGFVGEVPSFWGNMRSLAYANLSALNADPSGCMPAEWGLRNGLVQGSTLLTNANQEFCTLPGQ
jgi:hypothetical protein